MTRRSFFLGAGFSKALNPAYPTLVELSEAVVSGFRARYPAGAIRNHFDELPQGFDKDIEQLLTYLYSDWPWKASVESDLDNALYKAFVYEIAAALEKIPMVAIPDTSRQFIHFIRTLEQNSVISLNYDNLIERYRYPESYSRCLMTTPFDFQGLKLVVEEAYTPNRKTSAQTPWVAGGVETGLVSGSNMLMFAAREWLRQVTLEDFRKAVAAVDSRFRSQPISGASSVEIAYKNLYKFDDFYQVERPTGKALLGPDADLRNYEGSTGKVIHLHGSIDWLGDTMWPTIRVPDEMGTGRLEKLPAIVPPVMDKSRHYAGGRFRDQWIKAHAKIQNSQEIVVIGFSFPLTDISCQFLFRSAVAPGTRVIVVNRDSSESFVERYKSIFEHMQDINVDFSFLGDDALKRYIDSEVS